MEFHEIQVEFYKLKKDAPDNYLKMIIDKYKNKSHDKNVKLQMVLMSELMGLRRPLDIKQMQLLEKLKEFSKMLEISAAKRK